VTQAEAVGFRTRMLPRRRICPRNRPGFPDQVTQWNEASAMHNEHGVAGVAKTPSVPQAHSDMGVGDNIRHHWELRPPPTQKDQGTQAPSRMEVDAPQHAVGDMSTGPWPSAPVIYASSVKGPRMSTGVNPASASGSSSVGNRGAGQIKAVPSKEIVPSVGARTPLPDM
jgi:hypothetical protein